MEITLTVPDSILMQLRHQAVQLNMSLNDLILTFFRNGIAQKQPETTLPMAQDIVQDEESLPALEDIIARNRAMPPQEGTIIPATKTGAELAAELTENPPSEELMTFDEMWPLWQAFEQELKVPDEVDGFWG